jgi:hypothetical protein
MAAPESGCEFDRDALSSDRVYWVDNRCNIYMFLALDEFHVAMLRRNSIGHEYCASSEFRVHRDGE